MNEKTPARDGVPEDYPGRIVGFPDGVTHVVLALFGVQSGTGEDHAAFVRDWQAVADTGGAVDRVERAVWTDGAGQASTLLVAYGTDAAAWRTWWSGAAAQSWWQGLPQDGPCGYWREVMTVPAERFNYAAGTEDRVGSAGVLPLHPCATFGYWGAYRDRLPASAEDAFESPLAAAPAPVVRDTRGRRVRVVAPDNLCFIREGQGWGGCGAEERAVWDEQMNPVIDTWVARLGADPVQTGCLSIRDVAECDPGSGADHPRRSQFAFLLSLGHIEQAARTDPAHLAVHGAFVKMYREPRFTPQMHVWVELAVLKRDELDAEYVNCDPGTGLLPFFAEDEG